MFEKRSCLLRRGSGAGMQGTGAAVERATSTESGPSQSSRASGAVCTSRRRTKHGTRGVTPARQNTCPAWSRALAPSVTGAFSAAPSPPLSPDRLRRARLHRESTRGFDAASVHRSMLQVTRHGAFPGAHRPALYLPTDPDSPVGTAGECIWTGGARGLSSAVTARRAGDEMAGIGTEVRTGNRLGALGDNPAAAAARSEPSCPEPHAMAVARRGVARQRMPSARRAEREGVRERFGGAGTFRNRGAGGVTAVPVEVAARVRKKHGGTTGCVDIRAIGGGRRRGRLTPDNCCYRASIR